MSAAKAAGCSVSLGRSTLIITAPSGKAFPNLDTVIVTKRNAPEYDVVCPMIEAVSTGEAPDTPVGATS